MVGISSVWDVVPDDGDLYREVFQEHFGNTNLQVIAVFKVGGLLAMLRQWNTAVMYVCFAVAPQPSLCV